MIISNESNILTSRVLSHFNRSRQLLFTIKLRYKDLEKVCRVTLQDLFVFLVLNILALELLPLLHAPLLLDRWTFAHALLPDDKGHGLRFVHGMFPRQLVQGFSIQFT